ncbi:LCP family protein [Cyanobium sp. NIES-981]|uniref:LCP family protein n=1 Tax=Cyanobium sp. NIES-981 TaxID=1851505 RepID=UPI0007DD539A|nr:LCP family protein [Cyanobium sp. NIES-981]SBO42876.1 Transcriptional regulator [Cyanobium sp. NIES-981]
MLLAMLIGLGGGLLASMPLAEWLSGARLPENPRITNPFTAWRGIGNQNILVLGTDVGGGNTDVIATLRIEGGTTYITQVPRDTYIEPEGYGPQKINALYAIGGTDLLEQELSRKLGQPITHHLVVNLRAIRHMADALGGIEVDVPKRMRYTDRSQGLTIDLQPGPQLLKGNDLEGFLRFRHDEWGDIGRIERQQLALKALFRKLTRPENLVRLPVLLNAGGKDVKTDLGPMELGGLITAMGTTELRTERLGGRPFMLNGISYWEADWPRQQGGTADPGFDNRYVY